MRVETHHICCSSRVALLPFGSSENPTFYHTNKRKTIITTAEPPTSTDEPTSSSSTISSSSSIIKTLPPTTTPSPSPTPPPPPPPSSSSSIPGTVSDGPGTQTVTIGANMKRQVLGSPTRVASIPPIETYSWPFHPKPTVTVTVTITVPFHHSSSTIRETSTRAGSTRTVSTTLTAPVDKRQVLGSPSRSVPLWPYPIPTSVITPYPAPPPKPTSIPYPGPSSIESGTSKAPTSTLGYPKDKRQSLGPPTRTVLEPTTIVSISDIYVTKTETLTQTTLSTVLVPTTEILTTTYVSVSTQSIYKTLVTTDIVTYTTTTCTESTASDYTTVRTVSTTLTVPLEERQGFGGSYSRSES